MKASTITMLAALIFSAASSANQEIDSFSKAKRLLEKQVYNNHRITLYCGATFDVNKKVTAPKGFSTTKYVKRAKKLNGSTLFQQKTLVVLSASGEMGIRSV